MCSALDTGVCSALHLSMEISTLPRTTTLIAALSAGSVPILAEVHREDRSTFWADYGDEPLSEVYLVHLREVADSREWDPATVVWVNPSPVRQPVPGLNASQTSLRSPMQDGPLVSQQHGFIGYYVTLLEPGADPLPATLMDGQGGRVGQTPREESEETLRQQRAWWEGLGPQKQSLYRLQDVARRRRWNRGEADVLDQELRETVLTALEAGMRVPEIAQATELSRERIYQIRDGRR